MVRPDYKILILLVLSIPVALAQTITIDDDDPGYVDSPGSGGQWDSFNNSCGFNGDYRFETTAVTDQTATWMPVFPSSGVYEVLVHWCAHSARPDAVPYKITHANGSTNVTVNQTRNAAGSAVPDFTASGFMSLGKFNFTPSSGHNVMLNTSDAGDVSADAVRFRKSQLFVDNDSLCGGNAPCYAALQSAISDAVDGDTIKVYDGTYTEPIISCSSNPAMFCITKSLKITGDPGGPQPGPGSTPVIDGSGAFASAFVLTGGVSNVVIEGFEIMNFSNCCSGGVGSAVMAWNAGTSNITVNDNYMHDLGWNGVLVGSDDGSTQTGWNVRKNIISKFMQTGIELTNTNDSLVLFNEITGPSTITPWDIGDAGVGIEIATRAFDYAVGPTQLSAHGIHVIGNEISGPFNASSRAGINVLSRSYCASCSSVLDGVHIRDNTIINTGTRGVYLVAEARKGGKANLSDIDVEKNVISGNSIGIALGVAPGASGINGNYIRIEIDWNAIFSNVIGIQNGAGTTIEKNTIYNNTVGVHLNESAKNVTVRRNTIVNNNDGIVVDGDNSQIKDNRIENNNGTSGVHVNATANNTRIVRNFFINNVPQAFDAGTNTAWNDTRRGNCWSDLRSNPGFPKNYTIDSDSIDYRPCGTSATFTGFAKGGLIKIQDFTSFKKNRTSIVATLKEKNGILSGKIRITITTTAIDNKTIYASIRSNPDTIERFDSGLVKVSGIASLNKVVRLKGKVIETEDHDVNLTILMNRTSASALAYFGPLLELNITNAKVSTFNFKETK